MESDIKKTFCKKSKKFAEIFGSEFSLDRYRNEKNIFID